MTQFLHKLAHKSNDSPSTAFMNLFQRRSPAVFCQASSSPEIAIKMREIILNYLSFYGKLLLSLVVTNWQTTKPKNLTANKGLSLTSFDQRISILIFFLFQFEFPDPAGNY